MIRKRLFFRTPRGLFRWYVNTATHKCTLCKQYFVSYFGGNISDSFVFTGFSWFFPVSSENFENGRQRRAIVTIYKSIQIQSSWFGRKKVCFLGISRKIQIFIRKSTISAVKTHFSCSSNNNHISKLLAAYEKSQSLSDREIIDLLRKVEMEGPAELGKAPKFVSKLINHKNERIRKLAYSCALTILKNAQNVSFLRKNFKRREKYFFFAFKIVLKRVKVS